MLTVFFFEGSKLVWDRELWGYATIVPLVIYCTLPVGLGLVSLWKYQKKLKDQHKTQRLTVIDFIVRIIMIYCFCVVGFIALIGTAGYIAYFNLPRFTVGISIVLIVTNIVFIYRAILPNESILPSQKLLDEIAQQESREK